MFRKIDLHIHTNFSDGSLTPEEVIEKAVENGVSMISITDHDTIDAYTEELYEYAKHNNVKLINGVEISTRTKKCGIHVLGYNFDLNNEEFKENLVLLRNSRHDYLKKVAIKLNSLGYKIGIEKLDEIELVTKAHIALDVINEKNNIEALLKTFKHIPNKGEFIETIMNEGCPAYVEKKTLTPKTAADLIRKAGGMVVLAHPVSYTYEDNLSDEEILAFATDMNADGIESYCLYINRDNNEINDVDKWKDLATKNNFLSTIGSDFHMSDGLRPEIGIAKLIIDEKEIEKIAKKLR